MLVFLTIYWWLFAALTVIGLLQSLRVFASSRSARSIGQHTPRPASADTSIVAAGLVFLVVFAAPSVYLSYHGFVALGGPLELFWLVQALGVYTTVYHVRFRDAFDRSEANRNSPRYLSGAVLGLYFMHAGLAALGGGA